MQNITKRRECAAMGSWVQRAMPHTRYLCKFNLCPICSTSIMEIHYRPMSMKWQRNVVLLDIVSGPSSSRTLSLIIISYVVANVWDKLIGLTCPSTSRVLDGNLQSYYIQRMIRMFHGNVICVKLSQWNKLLQRWNWEMKPISDSLLSKSVLIIINSS